MSPIPKPRKNEFQKKENEPNYLLNSPVFKNLIVGQFDYGDKKMNVMRGNDSFWNKLRI